MSKPPLALQAVQVMAIMVSFHVLTLQYCKADVIIFYSFAVAFIGAAVALFQIISIHELDVNVARKIATVWGMLSSVVAH